MHREGLALAPEARRAWWTRGEPVCLQGLGGVPASLSLLPQARPLWELSRQLLQIPLRERTRAPSSRSPREVLSECPSPTRLSEPPSLGGAAAQRGLPRQAGSSASGRTGSPNKGRGSSGAECARARAVAALTAAAPRAEGRRVGGAGGSTSGPRFPRFPSLARTSGGGRREVVPSASVWRDPRPQSAGGGRGDGPACLGMIHELLLALSGYPGSIFAWNKRSGLQVLGGPGEVDGA